MYVEDSVILGVWVRLLRILIKDLSPVSVALGICTQFARFSRDPNNELSGKLGFDGLVCLCDVKNVGNHNHVELLAQCLQRMGTTGIEAEMMPILCSATLGNHGQHRSSSQLVLNAR